MALLWCDGFDHYGTDESYLLDGVYAQNIHELSSAQAATGTHSLLSSGSTDTNGTDVTRFVIPSAVDKIGAYAKVYFPALPATNTVACIFDFLTSTATLSHVSCIVTSTGALAFHRRENYGLNGESGTLIAQSDPVISSSGWNSIEVQVYVHDTLGWVRAAVNGVHVYQATGLDTKADTSTVAQIGIGNQNFYGLANVNGVPFYIDDLFIYDFVGDSAVDTDFVPTTDGTGKATNYIGDLQVMYLPPDADTAEADWTPSTGTDGYAMVDEVSPNDADYVYSTVAGDLSEYELTDLPEDITYIRGLMMLGRMSKADSGSAMIKFGMKSDATSADSAEFPITVEPTYWWEFQNTDPDSSARWTRASLNAAWFRLTRSV
jgi:hypothetical protein